MVDPKKWADRIEHERAEAANSKAQEQAAFLARRQLFSEEAPKLWPVVRKAFEEFCNAYNAKRDVLYCADIGPKVFVVRRKDLPNVILTVEGLSGHKLCVSTGVGRAAVYEPHVFENGHGIVSYVADGAPITPEEIAASALTPVAMI